MESDDVEYWEVSVVVACGMAQREGNHCLYGQRRVEVFDLGIFRKVPLQEMVGVRVQEEEEVMWVEKEGEMVLDQE
jgi:hypothetical protein